MKKKIASVSFLLLIVSLFTLTAHPGISNAVEADKADTEVGIGFNSNEEKPKEDPKEEPTLPSTKQPEEPTPVIPEFIGDCRKPICRGNFYWVWQVYCSLPCF